MMKMTSGLATFFLMLFSAGGGAWAAEAGNVGLGLKVANEQCASCHAVAREAERSPDPKAVAFGKLAKTPGINRTALSAAMQTSHRSMPNLIVKGDDLTNVIAYILSLQSP